jgi:hypothetical protein
MANELLTTAKLKSITMDDIGGIITDGGGLRGQVRAPRRRSRRASRLR